MYVVYLLPTDSPVATQRHSYCVTGPDNTTMQRPAGLSCPSRSHPTHHFVHGGSDGPGPDSTGQPGSHAQSMAVLCCHEDLACSASPPLQLACAPPPVHRTFLQSCPPGESHRFATRSPPVGSTPFGPLVPSFVIHPSVEGWTTIKYDHLFAVCHYLFMRSRPKIGLHDLLCCFGLLALTIWHGWLGGSDN
ncbi:hypothetical protein JDV02_005370 [Purpureocillium takamizusanense]|uniref:Uncharacterized protein n=1 Tax=Purpureocillium takamizusanense TaxID=2060973 RepID=A0A9Q8QIB4_9HYPO|nr:uncharacterized protein JDV02_005370 [Purpureocillium takamizusanense]UNI19162.1 hypothetical protein JDV02_005370 [Purpureocillium takamizusanense]